MNFDEDYNGKTLLKDWWGKVKNNFSYLKQKLEQEISDRETAVEAEETARDNAITAAVAEETSQREAADAELAQTKVDKIDGYGLACVGGKGQGSNTGAISNKSWTVLHFSHENNGEIKYTEVTIPAYVSDLKDSSDYVKKAELDDEPTADSDNPVKSGGVKAVLDKAAESCMAAINEANIKAAPHTSAEGYPITISDHLNGSDLIGCKIYGNADGVGKTITGGSLQIGNLVHTTYTELPIVQRGKNLFNWQSYAPLQKVTVAYADGVISLDNTGASVEEVFTIDNLPQGTYTVNADTSGASYYYSINGGSFNSVNGGSKTITMPNNINSFKMKVFPPSNGTLKLKNVQLEMGNSATGYEEYKENTVTAFLDNALGNGEYIDLVNKKLHSADTVTDIMMVTGDLALLDSERVTYTCDTDVQPSKIEVSYHQDINKVIEELKNAILSQGGNV